MFAGIGWRDTPDNVLQLMWWIGYAYTTMGRPCATGACKGPDQAFANGAIAAGGVVRLSLPWWKYEVEWHQSIPAHQKQIEVLQDNDAEAYAHAVGSTQGVRKLFARNYRILNPPVKIVVGYTKNAAQGGGTGHTMKIALSKNLIVHDLADPITYDSYSNWVNSFRNYYGV